MDLEILEQFKYAREKYVEARELHHYITNIDFYKTGLCNVNMCWGLCYFMTHSTADLGIDYYDLIYDITRKLCIEYAARQPIFAESVIEIVELLDWRINLIDRIINL